MNASATVRADATLEVGAAVQAVEVTASAIALSTENAKPSVTMNNKLVDELPLVVGGTMRSPFNLAALTPEAKNVGGDNGFIPGGGQAAGYGTNLDGVSANSSRALSQSWVAVNAPSIEAVTEVPGANGPADLPGFYVNYNDATRNSDVFRGSWDYVFSPTVFNHFYGGGNNWKENHDPP